MDSPSLSTPDCDRQSGGSVGYVQLSGSYLQRVCDDWGPIYRRHWPAGPVAARGGRCRCMTAAPEKILREPPDGLSVFHMDTAGRLRRAAASYTSGAAGNWGDPKSFSVVH